MQINILCPQCQSELHSNESGTFICSSCGYSDLAEPTTIPVITEVIDTPAAVIQKQSFFEIHKTLVIVTAVVTLIVISAFFSFQQIKAVQLVSDADALNQKQQYSQAYALLQEAASTIVLPQTKQSIEQSLVKTKVLVTYQQDLETAKQLAASDNNTVAVGALVLPSSERR